MKPKEQAERLWNLAVEQPLGLIAETDEPTQLCGLLLAVRKESDNPELFQFTVQVKGSEVWIIRSQGLPDIKVEGAYKPLEE